MHQPDTNIPAPVRPPLSLLREDQGQHGPGRPDHDSKPEQGGPDGGRVLVCRVCRRRITTESARMIKAGRHLHVFANPMGLVFEIACFSVAAGCLRAGPPCLEFTWFPGYAWQPALCSGCGGHLGWFWQDASGDGFWGLLPDQLDPEDED